MALSSRSTAEHVAACIALSLNGPTPYVKDGENHYVVTRQNGWGRPVVRIDVSGDGSGSKIEVRRSVPFNTGISKITTCADADESLSPKAFSFQLGAAGAHLFPSASGDPEGGLWASTARCGVRHNPRLIDGPISNSIVVDLMMTGIILR